MGRGSQTIIGALPPAEPRAEPACEKTPPQFKYTTASNEENLELALI